MRTATILFISTILCAAATLKAGQINSYDNPPTIQSVIFEDFEQPSSWNGANPPAGWSVIDDGTADGTWDNFDWSKYAAWGGNTARVSGGTANRYNNDWIVSPSVDFSIAFACTLFYRHYYDDFATQSSDSALVMLSNDGGSTWGDTVVVYSGSDFGSDTVPDSEYFDISSFAAGYSAVQVAFQYVKRQPVLVGSWRIDDVTLRADGSVLMIQNFESAWGPYGDNPPAGWAISDVNVVRWDENDWHQANLTDWGNIADVFWSPVEQQDELLISEAMDFSDGTYDIILTFKQWYDDQPDTKDTAFVIGSIDGGSSWPETLAIYQGSDRGSFTNPNYETLNMLDWANNQANVMVGFRYVGNNDGKWYIDSVRVDRVDMLPRDIAVTAISAPPALTIEGYRWPVSATVENVGLNTCSFDVVFLVADTNGTGVYADTQAVTNLASTEQRVLTFDTWRANQPFTHALSCYIRLVTDMDHSNDTMYVTTYTYPHSGSAGPVEGWAYADNITGGGAQFGWIEISSSGAEITFPDNDNGNSGMIDMGIDFDYFGTTYDRIAVSTNGWLSFVDSTGSDNSQSVIPNLDGPGAMIALLWADLDLRGGHVYHLSDPIANIFIVEYDSVEFNSTIGSFIGMEVVFDGTENTITLQYRYLDGYPQFQATIGLENQAQDAGLPYNNNGQYGQAAMPNLAITYTFLPPHDIKGVAIDQPGMLVRAGATYSIQAQFRNAGANTETFDVVAIDNFGYANTQTVTNLPSLGIANVTFPNWAIVNPCTTYEITVYSDLTGDLHRSNDTLTLSLIAINSANVDYTLDGGTLEQLEYFEPDTVLANEFEVHYYGANLSAVAYKFSNDDDLPDWPDTHHDSVWVYIFIDSNDDNIPDADPLFTSKVLTTPTGWTIWNVACETTITLNCRNFWAGWSVVSTSELEAIGIDHGLNYPNQKWIRQDGIWQLCTTWPGDYFIRAFVNADPATAPNAVLGTTQVNGAAPPDGADTASTYIQNTGTGCDLGYKVTVVQSEARLRSIPGSESDPIPGIAGFGGPDVFGYTWEDSDDPDPDAPEFLWTEISGIGTEVNWDFGNSDDGYTNPIPMGMTFNFYGANYDNVIISSNGWVSFVPASDPFAFSVNTSIPLVDELNGFLAVEWDNLVAGPSGHCYYYHDLAANAFIISWINWGHQPGPTDIHDFQVLIDGTKGTILYQYRYYYGQLADYTIGIESEPGTDGLQVAYNQPYLHHNLAIVFEPPIFWLSTDLPAGTLPPLSQQTPFNIFMNARALPAGVYDGAILIQSNDVDQPVATVDVHFEVEGVCAYTPGDVNGSGVANGIDVVFMVNFFRGYDAPHEECPPCAAIGTNMLYPQGDVNASCSWNGIDVTYFVNYLKGIGPALRFCGLCPPAARIALEPEKRIKPVLNFEAKPEKQELNIQK